jgi:hypothetical protein
MHRSSPQTYPFKKTAAFLALALTVSFPVAAQSTSDSAAAEALYEQGKTLMAQGKSAEACPKFEESQRLDPGTGTLLNLALCYEQTKRLASAWSKYLEAASSAATSGNAPREKEARKQADRLRPRLSYVVVRVDEGAKSTPGLEVRRDGQLVGGAQWGAAIPADEGEHEVTASAPGRAAWRERVVVKGEGSTTSVTVPALAEGPTTTPAPVAAAADETPDAASTSKSGLGTQRVLALVAGGVGVVGVGVGTVFGLQAKSRHDEAEKYCDGAVCTDQRGVTAGNDARAAGNISTIAMIIGVVGIAGGVTLWFTAPRENANATTARVELGVGRVQVEGTF